MLALVMAGSGVDRPLRAAGATASGAGKGVASSAGSGPSYSHWTAGSLSPAPVAAAVTTSSVPAAVDLVPSGPVAGAAGAGSSKSAPSSRAPVPTTAAPVLARPENDRSAPPPPPVPVQTQGAVWPGDFPDPSVLNVGGVYYAYSTEVGLDAVPTIRSLDLVHWSFVGDALAALPAWSNGNDIWAPAVIPDGLDYVLFYTTRDARTGDQCISRAQSTSPAGPFLDATIGPFVCQLDQGGDIDPDPVVAPDGTNWLIFKSQGTLEGQKPRIWAQRVSGGWTQLQGSPVAILGLSQKWEGSIVEAPSMIRQGSQYVLFYSGNDWASGRYGVGYAICSSVTGPCHKPQDGPLLSTHANEAGPGSASIFTDRLGQVRIAFHAWTPGHVGYPGGARSLRIGSVTLTAGRASISG